MIKYKKQIQIDLRRNGYWKIETDLGDVYDTTPYNEISIWWEKQNQSELRAWQKDICIRSTADIFGMLEMFDIYKKGKGWNQTHDICLMHNAEFKIWVLSTQNDFWICQSDGGNIVFNIKDSLGSILNQEHRKVIYEVYDALKKQFNPENLCRWKGKQ